jgi:hypothetical protein
MSSILVNDTPEDAAPVETRRSAVSVRTSGSRRSRQHAANPSSNYHPPATYPRPGESIPRNNAVSNAPRGFDVHSVPTAVTNPAPTSATSLGKQTLTRRLLNRASHSVVPPKCMGSIEQVKSYQLRFG